MIAVNNLLKKILIRTTISSGIFLSSIFLTGVVGDAFLYLFNWERTTKDIRTSITQVIFSSFLPIFAQWGSFIIICLIANILIYFALRKYLNKYNIFIWDLLLFLPCLLLYSTTPSKEYLFFISATSYIILECEHLFGINLSNRANRGIFIAKYTLLAFMIIIRGPFCVPYIIVACLLALVKRFNLNLINSKNLNLKKLFFLALLVSLFFNYLINIEFPEFYNELIVRFNGDFSVGSILSRTIAEDTLNFINPLNLIRISFLSFFPTLDQFENKPYVLLILYESIMMIYLFIKIWSGFFYLLKKDNYAKLIFSFIFGTIIFCYLSLYGIIGYFNLGASQRFRVNIIPLALFMPLISIELIKEKKETIFKQNNNQIL